MTCRPTRGSKPETPRGKKQLRKGKIAPGRSRRLVLAPIRTRIRSCAPSSPVSSDREAERQRDRGTETERQGDRETEMQADRQANRQTDGQTDRQTDRQTQTCSPAPMKVFRYTVTRRAERKGVSE